MRRAVRVRVLLVSEPDRLGKLTQPAISSVYSGAMPGQAPTVKRPCDLCNGYLNVVGANQRPCLLCRNGVEHDTCRPCPRCDLDGVPRGWRWYDPMTSSYLEVDELPKRRRRVASGPRKAKKQGEAPDWTGPIDRATQGGSYDTLRWLLERMRMARPVLDGCDLYQRVLRVQGLPIDADLDPLEWEGLDWLVSRWPSDDPVRIPGELWELLKEAA